MARSDPQEIYLRHDDLPAPPRTSEVSRQQSGLPNDAVAVIERATRSVTQSGKAREKGWRLRFGARRRPFADPLTGWTGGEDPLAHVALHFPTRAAAVRYAERHGVRYELREPEAASPVLTGGQAEQPPLWLCCWPAGPHALCCGDYPLLKEKGTNARQA